MLRLHRAERADRLATALADVLAEPPDDPFTGEVVAVHSRGIERWLAQELSTRLGAGTAGGDGVCANVEFPFPSRVIARAMAAAGPPPEEDPWRPEALVWPLLAVLDARAGDAAVGPLRAHLGDPDDVERRGRRLAAVRRVASLFDRYAVHRPQMIRAWAEKSDVGAAGEALGDDEVWQPALWRLLRERLEVPSPAERLAEAVVALTDGAPVDLPDRLSLFGLTALPAAYVEVLAALAAHRDVHVLLLHPSPALWERIRPYAAGGVVAREADRSADVASHPLLRSWGRDVRESQLVLAPGVGSEHHWPAEPGEPRTLLARIQADIRADRRPPGAPLGEAADLRPLLAPGDTSLQVHGCHGRTRQVEVLRDAVLHLLAADPTLEPRDVIVLCPDIEEFAPLVTAVFDSRGDAALGDALPDLRVRLADRALRQTNPLLRVAAELLDLAAGRTTASDVVDLAARAPVRARFRLSDDDLERVEGWVAGSGIRWGFDLDDRARHGLPGVAQNTWRAGLDRVLLGVAMPDVDDLDVGGVVPLDDVEGDVDLAGRLAELVERLSVALGELRRPQPIAEWRAALLRAVDALTATSEDDRWQQLQLSGVLDAAVRDADADAAGAALPLHLAEVQSLLDDRLRGRPTRANHRTGDLVVCTLVPMRAVPHRVVCLLGMDDGAIPRRTARDGDDLLGRAPAVGDRDARTEDRQLLLDALLAASQHVVVVYTSHDLLTGEPRTPAVPIGELLDVVDRTVRTGDPGRPARAAVVRHHPLQASDPRSFDAAQPWGFDARAYAGAAALAAPRQPRPRFLDARLAPEPSGAVELDDLIAFLQHPVRAFLRRRLGVRFPEAGERLDDGLPVGLDPLEAWAVGDRLLRARRAGAPLDRIVDAERARGTLPPGALADDLLATLAPRLDALLEAAAAHADLTATLAGEEVAVALPDGRRLVGAVGDLAHDVLVVLTYSRLKAKHRLSAWARLLALTASKPERPWRAVLVGRGAGERIHTVLLPPLGDEPDDRAARATDLLAGLVATADRGLREPLPLYCAASEAWAAAVRDEADPEVATGKVWRRGMFPGERDDEEHREVLGDGASVADLLREGPRADERGPGWDGLGPSRFARYAHRLWDPLLAHELRP